MKTRIFLLAVACVAWCLAGPARAQYVMPMAPGMAPQGYQMAPQGYQTFMMTPPPGAMVLSPSAYPVQQVSASSVSSCDSCGAGAGGCTSCGDCDGDCDCGCDCCPGDGWCHRLAIFGEVLYMRSRDSEVAYAVEVNTAVAPPTPPVQVGPVGVLDTDYEPNWRGGLTYVLDEASSITGTWTMFDADTTSRTDLTSGIIGTEVVSLLVHPTTAAANQGAIFSDATYSLEYDTIDLDYRELLTCDCWRETSMIIGARYANLEQNLAANTRINGNETVLTDIDFDGIGTRLGLETYRYTRRGLYGYGRGIGSLLVGDFDAKYDQGQNFDASVVDTHWEAGRMVPIIDLEFGVGWMSCQGYWRVSTGYMYSAWFNVVKTDEWIKAVQTNNFVGLGDGITFDGLVTRVEARF